MNYNKEAKSLTLGGVQKSAKFYSLGFRVLSARLSGLDLEVLLEGRGT